MSPWGFPQVPLQILAHSFLICYNQVTTITNSPSKFLNSIKYSNFVLLWSINKIRAKTIISKISLETIFRIVLIIIIIPILILIPIIIIIIILLTMLPVVLKLTLIKILSITMFLLPNFYNNHNNNNNNSINNNYSSNNNNNNNSNNLSKQIKILRSCCNYLERSWRSLLKVLSHKLPPIVKSKCLRIMT